ncbi:MAG: hypothetical protein ACTSUB_00645 [Candidatus Thorarchaeota archaeon]
MAKYLVHQQFYDEDEDTIVSRDKQIRVSIPGAKEVVASFVEELLDGIDLIPRKKYGIYLLKRAETLPIDADKIESEFLNTISQLDESGKSDIIITNFLIGAIRTALQKAEFEKCIVEVKIQLEKKMGTETNDRIQDRLEYLYSTSDPTVSLLHNLSLLRLLTAIYGTSQMFDDISNRVREHCETLVDKLTE